MDHVLDGASGAPHPDAHQKTAPRGGDRTSGGKLHEVGSRGNGSDENGEDKEHKDKGNHAEAEKNKTMKKRVQRRKRRPLGSVFVGHAPQKRSLADSA